jgi:hypothetical protein
MVSSPTDYVAARIADRYANPARVAYTYLFRLKPDSDFSPLVPDPAAVLSAWIDEGEGLAPASAETAVEHCQQIIDSKLDLLQPRNMTSHHRRQMMSRTILFSVEQPADDLVTVRLLSRALYFSPKGDREAFEEWKPTGEVWYSAYRPE